MIVTIPSSFVSSTSSLDPPEFKLEKSGAENQFRFVQWFEVIDISILPVDEIYAVLNCQRLRWQRTPSEDNSLSFSKEYESFSLESIHAVVQIVLKYTFLHFVAESSPRRAEVRKFDEENETRKTEEYYVSRFFTPKCEEFSI